MPQKYMAGMCHALWSSGFVHAFVNVFSSGSIDSVCCLGVSLGILNKVTGLEYGRQVDKATYKIP